MKAADLFANGRSGRGDWPASALGYGEASLRNMCGVFPGLGDSGVSFSAAIFEARPDPISPRNLILVSRWTQLINYEARTC
jgi:hypothetical protein